MSQTHACPECGAGLPADAPGGLCPKCLMGAAFSEKPAGGSPTDPFEPAARPVEDWETIFGTSEGDADPSRPAGPVDLDGFKRAVQDLGLIRRDEFERFVAGALGGVPGLARALVQAGKLTPYQAGALCQGKARGLVIGNYFILDKLGAGGMGVVFKARHRRLGRVVALKILPPSLARDRDLLLRFRREVDVAARLSHPNIVSVLDADEDRGVQFMTMEYIEGNDLDRLVRQHGPLPVEQALDCVIQAARGLEAAHAQGIVHRDIKPGNLMLDASGQVRVLDLGLARLVEASNPLAETAASPLTQAGICMGTADYMAPEQGLDSRTADHRADIYSLGCTLYYLLARRPPFVGATVLARLMAHQEQAAPSLLAARPEVPPALDAAYRKMMAKRPTLRPGSMTEVIALLESCRTSAGEAEEARSGLKTFSQSVILKRAAPKGTTRDSSVFRRDEPAGAQLGADLKREDVLVDYQGEKRPAAAPVSTPVASKPAPTPVLKQPESAVPRQKTGARSPAFAVGALILLALGGLGYALISRGPGTTADPDKTPAPPATPVELNRTPETTSEASWVSLFNGRDLDGWREHPSPRSHWRVENGVLIGSGPLADKISSHLYTERGDFKDFHLRVEARIHEDGNSGVYFRASSGLVLPVDKPRYPDGFEVQINVAKNKGTQTGGLYANAKLVADNPVNPIRPLEWFEMDVIADGNRIVVKVNQSITAEFIDQKPSSGHIALQQLDTQTVVEFRKIEIRELHARSAPAPALAPSATFDVTTYHAYLNNDWYAIAVSADGGRVLIGGRTQSAELLDVDSIKLVHSFGWLLAPISDVALTPDGRRGLVATYMVPKDNIKTPDVKEAGTLRSWDLTTGKALFPMRQPYPRHVTSVAISADGRRGLSGGAAGELTLWDLTTGQSLRPLGPQQGEILPHAMAFLPDGRRAATGGADQLVHVWNLETGRPIATWRGHDRTISGLAVSADGRRIVTGSFDGTVILWDVDQGKMLHRFETPDDRGAKVAFDDEGHIVAAGNGTPAPRSRPGRLIVWDANTYAVLRRDETPFAHHLGLATLPHGRVLTTDQYGIRLWTPRPPGAVARATTLQADRSTAPIDLIAQIQPETFRVGQWQIQDGDLLSPTTGGARLQFPTVPPPEYRIDLEVERVGPDPGYGFALGLLVDGRQTELAVDHKNDKGEKLTGLDGVDGVPIQFSLKVHRGALLVPSRPARFALTVRRDAIDLTCDGSRVLDWKGDPTRLIPLLRWKVPDPRLLFLATASAVRFRKITLTPLTTASRWSSVTERLAWSVN